MSLTSLIRGRTPVRERLADWFPKPKMPLCADLTVPPLAQNRSLVGTAYDYLLRFQLERAMPFAVRCRWAAEVGLENLRKQPRWMRVHVGEDLLPGPSIATEMDLMILQAQREVERFLVSGSVSKQLIHSALELAHCDLLYRIGRLDARFGEAPLDDEVLELRRLVRASDIEALTAKETCLLNPDFGMGTTDLNGADADLLLDDMLVDVKTTAKLDLRVESWRQLIGYAALNEHFPIGGDLEPKPIRRIGIYFARHSYLASWPLRHLVDADRFSQFALWLANYASTRYAKQLIGQAKYLRRQGQWSYDARRKRTEAAKLESAKLRKMHSSIPAVKRPSIKIERARVRYRPKVIQWLFIAEAPPAALDRFFYFESVARNDWLYLATMRALYTDAANASADSIRESKKEFLRQFQTEGCYLIDVCDQPISKDKTKWSQVRDASHHLERKLDRLRLDGCLTGDTKIILVSSTVHKSCYEILFNAGFNVTNKNLIEFPAYNHQKTYQKKLRRLLNSYGRISPSNATIASL